MHVERHLSDHAAFVTGLPRQVISLGSLIDYGIHPPTIYFPGLVEEALMIEPTESVTQEGLDAFVDALARIREEDPDVLRAAPQNAAVARVDEVSAAKRPILSWRMMDR